MKCFAFRPRPGFLRVNAACVTKLTTDIILYLCAAALGEVHTGAFQDNHTADEIANESEGRKSASECEPADRLVWPERFSSVSVACDGKRTARVLSNASSSCPRLRSQTLIGLCAEERLRSADQVTWFYKLGWSQSKTFLGRLGNRIMILKAEPWLGFNKKEMLFFVKEIIWCVLAALLCHRVIYSV